MLSAQSARALGAAALLALVCLRSRGGPSKIDDVEALMLRSPSPVRIALKGGRMQHHYSRWHCVGDLEQIESIEHRACVFENVCYDTAQADFVYYSRHNNMSAPVLYDHVRGEQQRFRWRRRDGQHVDADFVALNKWVPYKPRAAWSARLREEPLPQEYTLVSGLTALSAPFVSTNLGHVAWDEGLPLLIAMTQLGVYTRQLRVLRTRACADLGRQRTSSSSAVCAKFAAAFIAPLTGDKKGSNPSEPPSLQQFIAASPQDRPVCFERLLVGGSFDAFNSEALNVGKEPLIQLYRARVLAWHAIDPTAVPRRHQILLVRKDGRRTIHNFGRVLKSVKDQFSNVALITSTTFQGITMAQQLALVSQTTIAISPCGGVSMILPFLPEGAYAILMNYMIGEKEERRHGECSGCSWSMEAELWRHVRHIKKMYYQVWGPSDFARDTPGRDSSVKVDPQRLAKLIESALREMEPY